LFDALFKLNQGFHLINAQNPLNLTIPNKESHIVDKQNNLLILERYLEHFLEDIQNRTSSIRLEEKIKFEELR
jgi:hypothetical protein